MDLSAPLTREKLDTILIELRKRLVELYGPRLEKLILYGSQARGDAEPGSDIDVMVVLKGLVNPGEEIRRTGGIIASLSLMYDEVISGVYVSVEAYNNEGISLLSNVQQEGVVFYDARTTGSVREGSR